MNINTANSNSINQIQNSPLVKPEQNSHKIGLSKPDTKTNSHEVNISQKGQVGSYVANLPETQQQEIKGYMQSVRTAKANGNFDVKASANDAPKAFNGLAKQLSLTSEDALGQLSAKPPQESTTSTAKQAKSPEISAYAEVAAQTTKSDSIFDTFASFFTADSESSAPNLAR